MTITGASEGRYGLDLDLGAGMNLASWATVFAACDGAFRQSFHANAGTVGFDLTWWPRCLKNKKITQPSGLFC